MHWEARAEAPDGPVVESGAFRAKVAPGSRVLRETAFNVPVGPRRLYLVLLASIEPYGEVFREDGQFFVTGL